jgi:hypothetical protein
MSIESDHAAHEYLYHLGDVVNGIQDGGQIRESAFSKAEEWARILTRLQKSESEFPRKSLLGIFDVMCVLENEAEDGRLYPERIREIGAAVRTTFVLLLEGRCHDENEPPVPGIPRVR